MGIEGGPQWVRAFAALAEDPQGRSQASMITLNPDDTTLSSTD